MIVRDRKECRDFGDEYHLISLSQDIKDLCDYLGLSQASEYRDAGFAFVAMDAELTDYTEVWFCVENCVPWLSTELERVR